MKKWIYRHYKWHIYEVLFVGRHTETEEQMVVYKSIDKDNACDNWTPDTIWIRPLSMFLENVNIDWKETPRFEYIWNKKYDNWL